MCGAGAVLLWVVLLGVLLRLKLGENLVSDVQDHYVARGENL